MSRVITAPAATTILVANIDGAGDPSLGLNPVKLRTGFTHQPISEVSRAGGVYTRIFEYGRIADPRSPGIHTVLGRVAGSFNRATATVLVADNDFSASAVVYVGDYTFTSNVDYAVATATQATGSFTVAATPSTATLNIGGVNLTPAGGARTPGANNYNNTLGTVDAIAAEIAAAINDLANGFDTLVAAAPVGAVLNLTAVPVGSLGNAVATVSSDGTVAALAPTLTGGIDAVDNTATALAAAIDGVAGFSASAVGPLVTVEAPFSSSGNNTFVDAEYTGTIRNFTVLPGAWYMTGGQPVIGPSVILP